MLFAVVPRLLWRHASGNFTKPDNFTTLQKPVTKSNRTKMSCIIFIAFSLLRYQKRNVSYCLSTRNAHFTSEFICTYPYFLLQMFWGLRTCQQFLMLFCMKYQSYSCFFFRDFLLIYTSKTNSQFVTTVNVERNFFSIFLYCQCREYQAFLTSFNNV